MLAILWYHKFKHRRTAYIVTLYLVGHRFPDLGIPKTIVEGRARSGNFDCALAQEKRWPPPPLNADITGGAAVLVVI